MPGHTELDLEIAVETDLTGAVWVTMTTPEVVS